MLAIAVVLPLRAFAQTPAAPPPEAAPPPPPAVVAPPPEALPPPPPPPPPVAEVAAPMAPAAPAPTWKDLITVEGLADAYYMYLITGPTSLTAPVNRQFDLNSNTFTLNYAKVGIGVNADPVGFRLDLGYGATGAIINGANPFDATSTPFLVQQAYATFGGVKGLTVDFGKFVTTAGAEVIEANRNWFYSRSFLFFNIPLLHTGLRVGYKVNDMIALQASVVNGWNGVGIAPDVTADKTYGASVAITPLSTTSIVATTYIGKGETFFIPATMAGMSPTPAVSTDTRVLVDLVAAHTMGALGLNLNIDYVNDQMAGYDNFIGAALMGRFAINSYVAVAGRGEYASNGPGAAGGDRFNFGEFTLGVAFPMASRFELRLEDRTDWASTDIFLNRSGMAAGIQNTITAAALAWF
jgi:hypothetical protein